MEFAANAQPSVGGVVVVQVQGEVDVYTAPKLKDEIHRRMAEGAKRVVVDLADVGYMDSSGLGVLIGALKRAREQGGDLIVSAPNARIARIMDVTGLSRIFNVHDDTAAAVNTIKGSKS